MNGGDSTGRLKTKIATPLTCEDHEKASRNGQGPY